MGKTTRTTIETPAGAYMMTTMTTIRRLPNVPVDQPEGYVFVVQKPDGHVGEIQQAPKKLVLKNV